MQCVGSMSVARRREERSGGIGETRSGARVGYREGGFSGSFSGGSRRKEEKRVASGRDSNNSVAFGWGDRQGRSRFVS